MTSPATLAPDPARPLRIDRSQTMAVLGYRVPAVIYALAAFSFELIRVPWWLLKYIPNSGRQNKDWTYAQALTVRLLSSFVDHVAVVRPRTNLSLEPGAEKERFLVIDPVPSKFCTGPMSSNRSVQPSRIGATWYPAALSSSDVCRATVVLHIHGGAYVLADGRPATSGSLISAILDHTPATHVLSPQYRLSSLPATDTSNPFPAALQDTLSAYHYLIDSLKIPPGNIILSGDSAGGHAAIAFLRYLSDFGTELKIPAPSACYLWSPLIRPGANVELMSTNPNFATDYVPKLLLNWCAAAYAGLGSSKVLESPYSDFLQNTFKTEVPVFVNAGGNEVLVFDIASWTAKMKDLGNNITLDIEKNAPHDPLVLLHMGFGTEAKRIAQKAGEWAIIATKRHRS